jgi:hypothetical protein
MALDTAARRFSAKNIAAPWRGLCAFPDGAITSSDRSALDGMYSGISFGNTYTIGVTAGVFNMTGRAADLTPTTNINTAAKRFAAMNIGNPWRGINLFPTGTIGTVARLVLKNFYVGFGQTYTYTLTAGHGDFAWTGEPSFSDFEVTAQTGAYAMSGSAATLIATRTLFASSGAYAMTGNDVNLTKFTERTLVATSGTFAMTGSDVTFGRPRSLVAESGIFGMRGYSIASETRDNHAGSRKRRRERYIARYKGQDHEFTTAEEMEQFVEQAREAEKQKPKKYRKPIKIRVEEVKQDEASEFVEKVLEFAKLQPEQPKFVNLPEEDDEDEVLLWLM